MRAKKLILIGLVAAALPISAPAFAGGGSGWYAGIGAGVSDFHADAAEIDQALAAQGITASTAVDDRDTGYKAFVGYQFNPNFALEGGYVDFGKAKANGTFTAPAPGGTYSGEVKANGWNLDAVGILPVGGNFSLFGKLGFIRSKVDASASAASGGALGFASASSTETNPTFGVGAKYDFTPNVSGRLEWERFKNLGDVNTGEGDVDLWSIGVVYSF